MKIRQFVAIIFGCILIYKTWQSKYSGDLVDVFVWMALAAFGLVFFCISAYYDYKSYKKQKALRQYSTTFTMLGAVALTGIFQYIIAQPFSKPTLVDCWHTDDLGGYGIDFKKDGTYIYASTHILGSEYSYGSYTFSGDTIVLDRDSLDYIFTKKLVIQLSRAADWQGGQKGMYVMQVDPRTGQATENSQMKLVKDNRATVNP